MEAVRTSETSVDNYFTRQYIPEDNSEHHFQNKFIAFNVEYGADIDTSWFLQDGTRSHTVGVVLYFLSETYGIKVL
jgi:hypothetical protein